MRKIKIQTWKARLPEFGEDGKTIIGSKEVDESLLIALNNLIGAKKPEDIPRGIVKFQIFGKLAEAFDKASKTNVLELEEREYKFLKETVEKDIPSTWALNKGLSKAINDFLEAKDE